MWLNRPFTAGEYPYDSIFHLFHKQHLLDNEISIADDGYRDGNTVRHGYSIEIPEYRIELWERHEIFNMRLKQFRVMSAKFRHGIHLPSICARAVAQLEKLIIALIEPLFP